MHMNSKKTISKIMNLSSLMSVALFTFASVVSTFGEQQSIVQPVEIRQNSTVYNLQSALGVPLSNTAGTPAGSDGRLPLQTDAKHYTSNVPSDEQFKALLSWGSIVRHSTNGVDWMSGLNTFENAERLDLPRGNGYVLKRGQVGATFLNRPISFLFGSTIGSPNENEGGTVLSGNDTPTTYWHAEPHVHSDETHEDKGYYYSKHARKVFAIQSGPINIRWRKATPVTVQPSDHTNTNKWFTSGNNYYRLFTKKYVVSGSPSKTPKKIYWNIAGYNGPQVDIPSSRIGELKIVYNSNFPKNVDTEDGVPAIDSGVTSSGTNSAHAVYTRTLWLENDTLKALNREGRVFVELLGDVKTDGKSRYHLGYEIVDVYKNSNPADVTIDLGEKVSAWATAENRDDSHLSPRPVLSGASQEFTYSIGGFGSKKIRYYATKETKNLNDYQVYWMEEGLEGIQWPLRHSRYKFIWPTEPSKYSHFVRPTVANVLEAKKTAVQLPLGNAPFLQYQDPLDEPRGFLSEKYEFYTHLTTDFPQHRALLRFNSGENVYFERVFSWLDTRVKTDNLSQSTLGASTWVPARDLHIWGTDANATTFAAYDADAASPVTTLKPNFLASDQLNAPRYVTATVDVGARINAPSNELGRAAGADYWAGYILQDAGDSFNPVAYIDPLAKGFEKANKGSIIPVNAEPTNNTLEVYWFRRNSADTTLGFDKIYWPSALGRYTITYPQNPSDKIVLAGSQGSGALGSIQGNGSIYYQNNTELPGYNPNEEHAFMYSGRAYALRDDLNITSGSMYSSDPFVLLSYTAADGRPSMRLFKVIREDVDNGIVFDYIIEAGRQVPRPGALSKLSALPIEGTGDNRINYNREVPASVGDDPTGWGIASAAIQSEYSHYQKFTYEDRKGAHWIYRGLHAGPPALSAGTYDTNNATFTSLTAATAVIGQEFIYNVHASLRADVLRMTAAASTPLPDWLSITGLKLTGTPPIGATSTNLSLVISALDKSGSVTNTLSITVPSDPAAQGVTQAAMNMSYTNTVSALSTNKVTKVVGNRPPYLAEVPTGANSFKMRYYYRTREGYAWPSVPNPPAVNSIVPFLRPLDSTRNYVGDPGSKTTEAMDVVYRPVWPANPPVLNLSETLAKPKRGLPDIMGQTSLRVLYQQSIGQAVTNGMDAASVILHDATRDKEFKLGGDGQLAKIPPSIKTYYYQGKTYFPTLPPHLTQRFFFDPNRGTDGALVFRGKFVDEEVGEKYLLLNVLDGGELQIVKDLCPTADSANKANWDAAIAAMSTTIETFYEPTEKPGEWKANTAAGSVVGIAGDSADAPYDVGITQLASITHDDTAVISYALSAAGPGVGYVTLISNDGNDPNKSGLPIVMHIIRVGEPIYEGQIKVITPANPLDENLTFQHTADLGGRYSEFEYDWRIREPQDGGEPPLYYLPEESGYDAANPKAITSSWERLTNGQGNGLHRYIFNESGLKSLSDQWITMRYRPKNTSHPTYNEWSEWTAPTGVEGWIKRVLRGINPFNQRVTDLFNNRASTQVSVVSQAGKRWEGDIALNLENINNHGLIEIYETVLNRAKSLSLDSGQTDSNTNNALLLAAGYLNDLYMLLGNEAWADAADPTIGIGTKDSTYGEIATAMFAFKGQMPNLLEEELALLRGRDDFMSPGVATPPVYNRLYWNYTLGIDSGEVVYALNYNISEDQEQKLDGVINASDAARMYPQGHGDAYGHYLSALKGYYKLLTDADFDWEPRTETVKVLAADVQVDFMDERKFAAAGAGLARAGNQIFDLTWRKDYKPGKDNGWSHFSKTRTNRYRSYDDNGTTVNTKRQWGADQWATRTGSGAYLNWVVGNAMLPDVDDDPTHEGIKKIDRTTVPELLEIAATAEQLQTGMDNAEGFMTPLGLPEDSVAFDINPNSMTGSKIETHFEQIQERANLALSNAVSAFDDAKDVGRLLRSEEDSLGEYQAMVDQQENAYINKLIDLYGTPYADDIGAGKTYKQGYEGPDYLHYMYVGRGELIGPGLADPSEDESFQIDIQAFPDTWVSGDSTTFDFLENSDSSGYAKGTHYIEYVLPTDGFFHKPASWTGKRSSPGRIQSSIAKVIKARAELRTALDDAQQAKLDLDVAIKMFVAEGVKDDIIRGYEEDFMIARDVLQGVKIATELFQSAMDEFEEVTDDTVDGVVEALPKSFIAGLAAGGDITSPARGVLKAAKIGIKAGIAALRVARKSLFDLYEAATDEAEEKINFYTIAPLEMRFGDRQAVLELDGTLNDLQGHLTTINQKIINYNGAKAAYKRLIAEGDRIQKEREIFRKRTSAVIQGFRTRDVAFRIFRNEKLERYKTLFDLASRYTYLTAKAYDYETGLLHTDEGQRFLTRIINSRALGVIKGGRPQFAASNTGDPGLSSVLAEMDSDWQVLRGRLGFNNPDTYGTTFSLRQEKYRVLPGANGTDNWRDVLERGKMANILLDDDVRRHCMQVDNGDGLPVPGIVLEFSTVVADGLNLFGNPLAPGDSYFTPTTYATKIHAVGVAFDGYRGMSGTSANGSAVGNAGGDSPTSPTGGFLDPQGLAATPHVYLIPAGVDSMRSPPLGDSSKVRTWDVQDIAVPMPFNIGASDMNTKKLWQSSDSLSEELFTVRKHQAFRAAATASAFRDDPRLHPDNYTNTRLVGRSVWNSRWKLVIPGRALLNDAGEGLDRFIQTVNDIKIHMQTYSYSGN